MNIKRFEILEVTDKDIAISFWGEQGEKQIVILTIEEAEKLIKSMKSQEKI